MTATDLILDSDLVLDLDDQPEPLVMPWDAADVEVLEIPPLDD